MIYEFISKILINVLFISVFISIFFFTYGTYIEKLTVNNQMNVLANNFIDTFKLTGNTANVDLYNYINTNVISPDNIKKLESNDADALSGNKPIIIKVITVVTIFIICVSSILFYFVHDEKITNLKEILIESFIILIFIALTEFVFLSFFGSKYISIDTNNIKLEVINNLKKYSKSLN